MAGSIRKRGEHSWELRVFAGRDPDTRRKQYISRTVRGGRRAAEKELARLVAQVDNGLITARPGTVGELVWPGHDRPLHGRRREPRCGHRGDRRVGGLIRKMLSYHQWIEFDTKPMLTMEDAVPHILDALG